MKLQVQPGVSPGVLKILAILFGIIAIICIIISFIFFDDVSTQGFLLIGIALGFSCLAIDSWIKSEETARIRQEQEFIARFSEKSD